MREVRFGTFRAEKLRREKLRDANARVRVLVKPNVAARFFRILYYSAPDFGFRRDRAAFPLHRHKNDVRGVRCSQARA